jgi:hypothetical protein
MRDRRKLQKYKPVSHKINDIPGILKKYIGNKIVIFWIVTPCSLIDDYQDFGEKRCLHLQDWHFWVQIRF